MEETAVNQENLEQSAEKRIENQDHVPSGDAPEQDSPLDSAEAVNEAESEEEKNWRAFRDGRKRDRELAKEKEQEARRANEQKAQLQDFIAQHLESNGQRGNMSPAQQEQAAIDLLDNEIHTGGEIKQWLEQKFSKDMETRLEQRFANWQKEREREELPKRISETMPDYDDVMSRESIDYLEYRAPALARMISGHLSDPEKMSLNEVKAAYEAVKCIVPNRSSRHREDKKTDEIHSRPRSGAASQQARSDAPIQMTAESRKRAYQEMIAAERGRA